MHRFVSSRCRRSSQVLAAMLMLTVVAAYPSADLADLPLNAAIGAKPNLMVVLDNSESMNWEFLPDNVRYVDSKSNDVLRCYMYSGVNRMFYDPNRTYLPGIDANGKVYPQSSFAAASTNGYDATAKKVDLSTGFAMESLQRYNPSGYKGAAYYIDTVRPGEVTTTCFSGSTRYQEVRVEAPAKSGQRDERQNFANWFTYHRTRLLAARTGISRAFATLDHNFRVGMSTINESATGRTNKTAANFVALGDFGNCPAGQSCTRDKWFNTLFSAKALGRTPLVEAMKNVGEYFQTGVMLGMTGTPVQPITNTCQRNHAILVTDGAWNEDAVVGNHDDVVPALPTGAASLFDPAHGVTLTPGKPFPPPFREGVKRDNTLSDVAMKYWINDLRPDLDNKVAATPTNPATWQHMVTYSIGLGVNGTLKKSAATLARLRKDPSDPDHLAWPVPAENSATSIDDLWHATINGHGQYFDAQSVPEMQAALMEIIADTPQISSSVPLALSGQRRTDSGHVAFFSRYDLTQWSGQLSAYPIAPETGMVDLSQALWDAHALLEQRHWTSRRFASYSGAAGVTFAEDGPRGLSSAQLAQLSSTDNATDASLVINFLKGDRSQEFNAGTGTGAYRKRASLLGDAINAAPLFVPAPRERYADAGYPGFRGQHADRAEVVYLGANDGMLHAFDAATGRELWGYVPGLLINQPYVVTSPPISHPAKSTLINLSIPRGNTHLYYADGTPVSGDVDLANTDDAVATEPDWATLLVAGLNKGGRGFYALDITNPVAATDADVASKVMWEFPNDATRAAYGASMGYSFGKPIIVKTREAGWVVLVTSGYNNGSDTGGDGRGRLFVLNARTGGVISELVTTAGSASVPSGLAHISAYAENAELDNTTDFVYGGDLLGNVWRFDLSADPASWNVSLLAQLVDGTTAAAAQPVTTAPELARVKGETMVLVTTGRLLGLSDVPGSDAAQHDGQIQTLYGLIDNRNVAPEITPLRASLTRAAILTATETGTEVSAGSTPVTGSRGWYVDLPRANERVVTDGVVARGVYTVVSTLPSAFDVCQATAASYQYSINLASGAVLRALSLGEVFVSAPTLFERADGRVGTIVVTSGQGAPTPRIDLIPNLAASPGPKRLLWREIIDQ